MRSARSGEAFASSTTTYSVAGRPIYFPFLSGILSYDCETCDAPCCHSPGLSIGRSREIIALTKVQKHIDLFAAPSFVGSSGMSIHAPGEKCWFLDKRSQCRVESHLGRDAKPAGCRLYPFYKVRRIGDMLTVLPDFTCPITISLRPTRKSPSNHRLLTREMHLAGIARGGHPRLPEPVDMPWFDALVLENEICSGSANHLTDGSYLPFAIRQQALTSRMLPGSIPPDLERLIGRIQAFTGVDHVLHPQRLRRLIALTPVLRMMASMLPRARMPSVMLAFAPLVTAHAEMRSSSTSTGTIVRMFEERLPLTWLLSLLESRVGLPGNLSRREALKGLRRTTDDVVKLVEAVAKNATRAKPERLVHLLRHHGIGTETPLGPETVSTLYGLGYVLLRHGQILNAPRVRRVS